MRPSPRYVHIHGVLFRFLTLDWVSYWLHYEWKMDTKLGSIRWAVLHNTGWARCSTDPEIPTESHAGAVKQASDVGTAIFTLVSAFTVTSNFPAHLKPDPCNPYLLYPVFKMAGKDLCPVVDSSVCLVCCGNNCYRWPCGTRYQPKRPVLYVYIWHPMPFIRDHLSN